MKTFRLLLGLGCAAAAVGTQAQVLLNIDLSNLNEVTFTATSQNPLNDASVDAIVGVTLMDFFKTPTFAPQNPIGINAVNAGLAPTGAGQRVDTYYSMGTDGSYTGTALNLTGGDTLGPQWTFSTTSSGFTGSATANFSLINPAALPEFGASGQIQVGSYGSFAPPSTVVGNWEVVAGATPVPEPASVGLAAGLALGGVAFMRRRLKKDA